jgi:hypothetical protein
MNTTRAAFWIGDPREIGKARFLGCVSDMGSPNDLDIILLNSARSEFEMERIVDVIAEFRRTATVPTDYPIPDNLLRLFTMAQGMFRTDAGSRLPHLSETWEFETPSIFDIEYTYAWMNDSVRVAMGDRPFRPYHQVAKLARVRLDAPNRRQLFESVYGEIDIRLCHVPAPGVLHAALPR